MKSISERQLEVIKNKSIDLNSSLKGEFKAFTGDALVRALYNVAVKFVNTAVDNLNKADRVSSGQLIESIQPTDVIIMGKVFTININVNDYYKFIDKGVRGWQSGNPSDSPYAFKQPTKGGSGKQSSEMVTAIRKWLIKEGLKMKSTSKNPRHAISSRESRRQKITDTATSSAIVVAGMIRKHGLKKTNFWSDAEQSATEYASRQFGEALQIDIINSL